MSLHARCAGASALLFSLLGPTLVAQEGEAAPAPRRSLADGMIRQLVEVEGLALPRLLSGLEPGSGQGPLVMLRLGEEGEVSAVELPRGFGDHGAAVEPAAAGALDPEQEVGVAGAPRAPKRPLPPGLAKVRLLRIDDGAWTMHVDGGGLRQHTWPEGAEGRTALVEFLRGVRDRVVGEDAADDAPAPRLQLGLLAEASGVRGLQLWDAAREAGFGGVLLEGRARPPAAADDPGLQRIADIPAEFGWEVKRVGRQPICRGELLLLFEGEISWARVLDVYMACAAAGIWDVAIVGSNGENRGKLPLRLPFDEALIK